MPLVFFSGIRCILCLASLYHWYYWFRGGRTECGGLRGRGREGCSGGDFYQDAGCGEDRSGFVFAGTCEVDLLLSPRTHTSAKDCATQYARTRTRTCTDHRCARTRRRRTDTHMTHTITRIEEREESSGVSNVFLRLAQKK
jgi:hypothetical protein